MAADQRSQNAHYVRYQAVLVHQGKFIKINWGRDEWILFLFSGPCFRCHISDCTYNKRVSEVVLEAEENDGERWTNE